MTKRERMHRALDAALDMFVEQYKGWAISEDPAEDAIVAKKPGKPPLYATTVAQAKRIIDQRESGTATGHQRVMDAAAKAEKLEKGDKFEYLGTKYVVVANEGRYTNAQGASYVDIRAKEIDPITGRGRGERLINLRV